MFGRGSNPCTLMFSRQRKQGGSPLKQITLRECLEQFGRILQDTLFKILAEEVGPLSAEAELLTAALKMVPLSRQLPCARGWRGRPAKDRDALFAAFLAKSIYGIETTRHLIDRLHTDMQLRRLCGWIHSREIPHESTFSRAFQEFAETQLPQRVHESLIVDTQQGRLIGHITRDSTAIEARERFDKLPKHKPLPKRRRGRARKGEVLLPGHRLSRQKKQTLPEMLSELPTHCSLGVKKSSKGHQQYWRGYKLHIDVADGQLPVSCLITAASLHDSQAAIPLAIMTAERVISLYDVMDAAYDAHDIHEHSRSLGHVPLIAPNGACAPIPKKVLASRNGYDKRFTAGQRYERKRQPFTPAESERFKIRTMSERVNARLKDQFGARSVRVRGAPKIFAHLMFGVIALTVDQLLRLVQ